MQPAGSDDVRRAGEKFLALEHEVALILVETEAVSDAYPKLLESIATALGWQFGAVWEEEPAQAAFVRCVESWCAEQRLAAFAEFSRGLSLAPGYGLPGRVWTTGAPAWIREVQYDPNFPRGQAAIESGLHSGFCFPIRTALASVVVFARGALAANGGNSDNAKLCQDWPALMDSSGAQFSNEGACVSYGAHGGATYALAGLTVEPCADQPFDGLCVSTSGFGLAPTTFATTPLLKNGSAVKTVFLIVPASGIVSGSPFGHLEIPCIAGNVYSATATGISADSLSTPTAPGIPITANTVTRTSACP
jgi:hypothetical protein